MTTMTGIHHLAACYVGEVENHSRILGRAITATRQVREIERTLANTGPDLSVITLAYIARELRKALTDRTHANERVAAQRERFDEIARTVSALSEAEHREFWDECNTMLPLCPTFHLSHVAERNL